MQHESRCLKLKKKPPDSDRYSTFIQVMATFPYGIVNYTHQKPCFLKKIADHLPAVSALKTKGNAC